MKKTLLAAAAVASIGLAGLVSAAPATALACGTPALLVNGWDDTTSTDVLWWYSPSGIILETVNITTTQGYGDIALSPDAQTVYGVNNGSSNDDIIDLINANTGAVKGSLTLTGPAAGVGGWDGAAIIADGSLVIGSNNSNLVYKVDPATGASTEWVDYQADDPLNSGTLPGFFSTTGDFSQLSDGDVIALYTNGDNAEYFLARIHADGIITTVGQVPEAWGAGRVNDEIEFAQADGKITKIAIADIPSTQSTDPLTVTEIVDTGVSSSLSGAAGTQDSGTQVCPPSLPDTGISGSQALSAGLLAVGLGLAGAAGIIISRRKRA